MNSAFVPSSPPLKQTLMLPKKSILSLRAFEEKNDLVAISSSKSGIQTKSSRRTFITYAAAVISGSLNSSLQPFPIISNAAETIGKDPNCNDGSCLGIWDGLFADCPHDRYNLLGGAGCVSSQDDTPGVFAEPWDYSDSVSSDGINFESQMDLLLLAIQTTSKEHGDTVKVDYLSGRYLRVIFMDKTGEASVGEFYFTPNDTTVQFRLASMLSGSNRNMGRSLSNTDRSERIRRALRYTKVPVLRNRRRTFFFVESDQFDSFGPGYSEALGPPEEMSAGELNEQDGRKSGRRTRRLSDEVDPKLRIDWVESFPMRD